MLAALAMPGWPAGAQVAGPPPAAPGAALQPGPVITLVTGERGRLAGPGPGHAGVVWPGGPAGPRSLMIVGTGRAAYLIPAAARAGRDGRLAPRFAFAAAFPARSGPGEYTLTIRGTNRFGRPDTGDVADLARIDQSKPVAELTFRHGIARVKVPAGHYWAIGDFMDFFDARHPVPDERLVTLPQFTVTGNTTIRLSERAATSKVTMSTPRPAVPADTTVELARSGTGDYFEFLDIGYSIWVNPTRARPSIGRLRVYTSQQLVSPPGARGVPYAYYLSFRGPEGIIPGQHFRIRPAGLATVHDRFVQDSRATAVLQRWSFFPAQLRGLLFEASLPLRLPRRQTEYLTGNPAILWTDSLKVASPASLASVFGLMRVFRAGQHLNEDWDAGPLSPQPDLRPAGPQLAQPSAARAGNLLRLAIAPFSDGQPGHAGPQFAAGRYAVDQDGRQVAGGQLGPNPGLDGLNPLGFTATAPLSSRPSQVRLTLTASRPALSYPLSSRVSVTWTWRSAPAPRAMLPRGWACDVSWPGDALAAGRRCAVQPLLMIRLTVARLRLDGSAPPGRQVIRVEVGHLPLARATPVRAAAVSVSSNGGVTWHRAGLVRTGRAAFAASFTAPPGSYVTLRIRAADTAGGSITETIQRGYRVAP